MENDSVYVKADAWLFDAWKFDAGQPIPNLAALIGSFPSL
jgi:hypothetical protein